MAIASLVIGILSIPTCGGVLVGAIVAVVLGVVALVRVERRPADYGGKGMAIGGIVAGGLALLLTPIAGVIAAIAIPSLLRARVSANEVATIGDIRSVISAQAAYQSANGGLYAGRMECLSQPAGCIPGYSGSAFLDAQLASAETKSGYRRRFVPGQAAEAGGSASGTGVSSYAYVAVPTNRGKTGRRGFCGDSDGKLCYTPDGAAPRVADGLCDLSTCTILQ